MPSFSIITPTIGRASLCATCDSVQAQIGPYDEHIVVYDGQPAEWVAEYVNPLPRTKLLSIPHVGGYGAVPRDAGIAEATGDYLLFLDDDDVFNPGALDVIRQAVADNPGTMLLFRMQFFGYGGSLPDGLVLWRDKAIRDGNVSTGMIACPRLDDMPKWATAGVHTYNCDLWFIAAMAQRVRIAWQTDIVQTTRPHFRTL